MRAKVLWMALVFAACSKSPVTTQGQAGSVTPVDVPTGHPTVTPLPDPELNSGHTGRAPRRISVAQLKQSIQVTTGRQWSQIDALASSLGQADFAVTVSESTEANLVFAKFLEDGAREVCLQVAKDDLARTDPKTRVLTSELPGAPKDFTTLDDAAIEANLKMLALRFWGSPFDPAEVPTWKATFKKVATQAKTVSKPEQAWGAMCIAFMTDARFVTY